MLSQLRHRHDSMRTPLGFRLWLALITCLILTIWAAVGFGLYSLATNPEGVGHFVGRVVGGAIDGATGGRR